MSKKKKKNSIKIMQERYELAKNAKTGEMINCPACGNQILKKQYNSTFCSRTCKDKYWNRVDPEKRCRKNSYYYNVICDKGIDLDGLSHSTRRAVSYNLDYRTLESYCSEEGIDPKLQSSKDKYYKNVVRENNAKSRGYESVKQMNQSILDEELGEDGGSMSVTLEICNCCGLRADICQCGEY